MQSVTGGEREKPAVSSKALTLTQKLRETNTTAPISVPMLHPECGVVAIPTMSPTV